MESNDTIAALSTAAGIGAIAVARLSGLEALPIADSIFSGKTKLAAAASHTAHYGTVSDGQDVLDEVVATVFRAPNSYTGEDIVEFSTHGSLFIQQGLLELLIRRGARMATAGEFTKRAFLNGKMDLSQAEAVADLIESESYAAHATAMQQMRGGYSKEIASLRERLIEFAALVELELDFSDQDVEFADRERLRELLFGIRKMLRGLIDSFSLGNAIKNGIPVTIAGAPNVGKSTLLNALLGEERAIVSHIPGTTRDAIEDRITISGLSFRFIDTAGLRFTDDFVEKIGIERAYQKIVESAIVIYMADATGNPENELSSFLSFLERYPEKRVVAVLNKTDENPQGISGFPPDAVRISARTGYGLDALRDRLIGFVSVEDISGKVIVTNVRHYQALLRAEEAVKAVEKGLSEGIPGDLLAVDIRAATYWMSEISGSAITDQSVLQAIFSRFCIGK